MGPGPVGEMPYVEFFLINFVWSPLFFRLNFVKSPFFLCLILLNVRNVRNEVLEERYMQGNF